MIEPRLGMRVRAKQNIGGDLRSDFIGKIGTILHFSIDHVSTYIRVRFDEPICGRYEWTLTRPYLEEVHLTPEAEAQHKDQLRRQAHAEKYL